MLDLLKSVGIKRTSRKALPNQLTVDPGSSGLFETLLRTTALGVEAGHDLRRRRARRQKEQNRGSR